MDTRSVADSTGGDGTNEVGGEAVGGVGEEERGDDGEELEVDLVLVVEFVDGFHCDQELLMILGMCVCVSECGLGR